MTTTSGGNGYKAKVAVLGGNGFIGHHLARRLKSEGYYVLVIDIKECEYGNDHAHDITIADLRDPSVVEIALKKIDVVYQLAADMGGCQYVFTGEHDADILSNSALININVCTWAHIHGVKKIFYSSSACIYPQEIQQNPFSNALRETDAYPAHPDSDYGWEKLFSEHLYMAYARNYKLDVRIARYHNIYGPEGTYKGGKEKAPASISRKVAEADTHVSIWGDGNQTRSFLFIDDCVDATLRLMQSEFCEPINIGSSEEVTINDLWDNLIEISGKNLRKVRVNPPGNVLGVRGRNSDNTLIESVLNWKPRHTLRQGLIKTYHWIHKQVKKSKEPFGGALPPADYQLDN